MSASGSGATPLVSVAMITYNHEKFIAEAIEGVLMQKTDFPIELIIGEDNSTDRTREICLEYQAKHPEIIKVFRRRENLGMQRNFMETVQSCEGKYVALCEGDDYWTDPSKLRRQIDFLENNPEFAICHHRLKMINDESGQEALYPVSKKETTFEDLAMRQHIGTASCVFRNRLFEFPDLFLNVYATDYTLHLLNSYHGKIKLIDETMGVYRVQSRGEWSGRGVIERTAKAIDTVRKCREYFYPRAADEFDFHAIKLTCFFAFEKKDFKDFRKNYRLLLKKYRRFLNLRDFSALNMRYFLSLFPGLINFYARASERFKTAAKTL